jgi:hypothetical protein
MVTGQNMPSAFWRLPYEKRKIPARLIAAALYRDRLLCLLVVGFVMGRRDALTITLIMPFTRGGLIGYTQTIGRGGLGRLTTKGNKYYEYSNY